MSEEYVIQKDTLTNIANAIREKTGNASPLFPTTMPSQIRSIQTTLSDTADIPEDVVAEANRVASVALSRDINNAITFIAMSDMHEMGDDDTSDTTILKRYRRANLSAGQAAKLISDKFNLDFFTYLGDFAWGSPTTTIADGVQAIRQGREYIADVVRDNVSFITPGNHDPLTYSYSKNGTYLSPEVINGLIGTYCYKDFGSKKIRVICLNTADMSGASVTSDSGAERISGEQLQWFAEALDLSSKSDASDWGIIILSHHPLDWGNIMPAANCLQAYLSGSNYSATHNGVSVSYNFSGKNMATVIAQFHGHVHGFKVDYINHKLNGNITPSTVQRIAIPNACFSRNNEYGENGKVDSNGIEFGEESSYEKTDDSTGKNTAFCLVSIDLDEQVVYADCFGMGYDRIVSYGVEEVVTYSVTNNLANATNSNGASVISSGSNYSASITADEGYTISSIVVTMGGVDITASAVSGENIAIQSVSGDIVITVTTISRVVYDVTNLVPMSEEQNSTAIYNGVGYKNGAYASESGDGTDSSCVVTGWIPYTWSPSNEIYIRGASIVATSHVRFYGYNTKTTINGSAYAIGTKLNEFFTVKEIETNYYKLTPLNVISDVNYIRISLIGTGENLIITINEPIVAGDGGGTDVPATYTNLVPTSVTTDGSTVFNGTGYKNGTYASGAHTGDDSACVTTGFIWLPATVNAIYVKGAIWDVSNGHCRINMFAEGNLGNANQMSHSIKANESQTFFTINELGDNYYKFTPNTAGVKNRWYCMSLVGTGENLIITHDEPIE